MSDVLNQLHAVALERIEAAEKAAWTLFVEFVRADVGPGLAEHLDARRLYGFTGAGIEERAMWRLDLDDAVLVLRLSGCAEIAVRYTRARARGQAPGCYGYRNLKWEAAIWYADSYGGSREFCSGKFTAVRYKIERSRGEEARVVPTFPSGWVYTDSIEAAKAAARKFGEERRELQEEANQIIQETVNRIGGRSVR